MLTTAVKVYLNDDQVVALWDTGYGGLQASVDHPQAFLRDFVQFPRPQQEKSRPNSKKHHE